ncbi:uncharacterized protein METZ01_LOCUS241324, partial [marine metagenome]
FVLTHGQNQVDSFIFHRILYVSSFYLSIV